MCVLVSACACVHVCVFVCECVCVLTSLLADYRGPQYIVRKTSMDAMHNLHLRPLRKQMSQEGRKRKQKSLGGGTGWVEV